MASCTAGACAICSKPSSHSGNLDAVGDIQAQDFSRVLRDRLDELVPSYKDARGVASKFFDARDALEAGEKAVLWKGDPEVVRQQVAKMSANEQTLFREGYASALAQKMENLSDRTNVTNQIFQSPQARKIIDAIYGQGGLIGSNRNFQPEFFSSFAVDDQFGVTPLLDRQIS